MQIMFMVIAHTLGKLMKKNALAMLMASALFVSGAALADTVANDSAVWNVSAEKDSTSRLIVTPLNSIKFQFDKGIGDGGAFVDQPAAFKVTVDNGSTNATGFALEARAGAQSVINNGVGSSMRVVLNAGDEPLETDSWVTLVDDSHSYSGLEGLTGLNGDIEEAQATFNASLTDFQSNGAAADSAADMPDGFYSGEVAADFRATWTEAGNPTPAPIPPRV